MQPLNLQKKGASPSRKCDKLKPPNTTKETDNLALHLEVSRLICDESFQPVKKDTVLSFAEGHTGEAYKPAGPLIDGPCERIHTFSHAADVPY